MTEPTEPIPTRYEHSTFRLAPINGTIPPGFSGAILLIGSLIALSIALAYIGSATQLQAVAWAFVVAGVIATLDKWA